MFSELKKRYWPKGGMRRKLKLLSNRVVKRVSKAKIVEGLRSLGVAPGQLICVHSQMSSFGYVPGGAKTIISALFESVGGPEKGTILMPAFPMSGLMRDYLDRKEVIDLRTAPSRTGYLSEAFRKMPGVIRSSHPTHSACVKGHLSEFLIENNEMSPTSFGSQTPWGKFPMLDESYLLLINTKILTILHAAQERVNYPIMYDHDDTRKIAFIDAQGQKKTIDIQVMIPKLPYLIPHPIEKDNDEPSYLHLDEYPFVMPTSQLERLKDSSYYEMNIKEWNTKKEQLLKSGILKIGKIGDAEIGLLKAKRFLKFIEEDLKSMVDRSKELFTKDYLMRLVELRDEHLYRING